MFSYLDVKKKGIYTENLVVHVLWLTKHAMSQTIGKGVVIEDTCYDIIIYTERRGFRLNVLWPAA